MDVAGTARTGGRGFSANPVSSLFAFAAILFQLLACDAVAVVAMMMPVEQLACRLGFFHRFVFSVHYFLVIFSFTFSFLFNG